MKIKIIIEIGSFPFFLKIRIKSNEWEQLHYTMS
jgi:hypothetical protein